MQVILLKDVQSLGEQGSVLAVADGYARNYLFPQKMAVVATKGALKDLESRRTQLKQKVEKRYQEDLKRAKAIESLGHLTLEATAGDEGKLFGIITPKELAAALEEKTGEAIDRRHLLVDRPINRVGSYNVTLKLSPRVVAKLQLEVVALGGDKGTGSSADGWGQPTAVAAVSEEAATPEVSLEDAISQAFDQA